jgi:hypothetical protein
MPNTLKSIWAKVLGAKVQEEYVANAAISPGHLVELMSTNKVRVHATANGAAEKAFAFEDELQGNGVDDAYSAADQVQVIYPRPGDQVNAVLADGQNIAIGDKLVSAGDGTLTKYTADTGSSAGELYDQPNSIIGVAMEALDLSGSSGEESSGLLGDRRIRIRIV